jgi:hypothetical protein
MNKLILTLLLTTFSISGWAIDYNSKLEISSNGEINKYLEVTCNKNESTFCSRLCANESSCAIPETLCQDCTTQKSQLMYTIFTDINSMFKSSSQSIQDAQVVQFLKTQKFLTITSDSFLNWVTPENKDALKLEFNKLCSNTAIDSTLLVTVDNQNQADQLVGIVCRNNQQASIAPVTLNPEYSLQNSNFWGVVNHQIAAETETLKLKLSIELQKAKHVNGFSVKTDAPIILKMSDELSKESIALIQAKDADADPNKNVVCKVSWTNRTNYSYECSQK